MSFLDQIFGRAPQAAVPSNVNGVPGPAQPVNPNQANPGLAGTVPSQTAVPGNGTVPAGTPPAIPGTSTTEAKSGLDAFSDLWNTPANGGDGNAPIFNIDEKKLREAASKQNFVKSIPQELLQKALAGGADAPQALLQIINTVGTQSYGQSAFAASKMLESALEKQKEAILAQIPQLVKQHTVSDSLRQENPIFSNPAVAPILGAIQHQLTLKNPNATTGEIQKMAQDYLSAFVGELTSKKDTSNTQTGPREQDWSKFL